MSNSAVRPATWAWSFLPYGVISAVHVGFKFIPGQPGDALTKLLLMPLLALGVLLALRGVARTGAAIVLLIAIAWSWLGDGASTFFPFAPELPVMLLCFGLAHLLYIWLFNRRLAVRRMPGWAAVYLLWWVILLAVLWPALGGLTVAVAIYGLVLGGTAASATRCPPLVLWGGVLFLSSDSILAFRIFMPDAMPDWTSPLVMLTYCAGQGLIAVGAVAALRRTTAAAG